MLESHRGLARLVALEYLIAVPGGQGRQHRYLLADPPAAAGGQDSEPRETPRPVRDPRPRAENRPHAAETTDHAIPASASDVERKILGVGAERRTNWETYGGAR